MVNLKAIIQKWVAILIILVLFMGQYAITGFLATSYAIDLITTQSNNVQFRAYFKNGEEELTEIQSSIDAKDLRLKIDVAVKNEGYFNGQISFENAGFILNEATANNYINKIENNIIYLNQINAEETANIEVGIKYFEEDKVQASTLNQITTTKLNGTYTSSSGNTTIDAGSDVRVIWNIPTNTQVELTSKIQTNAIYNVNEQNKKIVQYLISSKLTNNAYPIKNTQITATVPTGATNVEVHKRTTKATNGEQEFTPANYSVENNVLTINVNNTEIDGKISWMKDVKDIFVVTYEYPENTDLSAQTIVINGKITAQNNVELNAEQVSLTLNEEKDGIASISKQERETSIYKGKIYSGEGRDITSYSTIYVDYVNGIKDIEITENASKFLKEIENNGEITTQENNAKVNIKSLKFNKAKVESVLGNIWSLIVGETTITNETQTDENGNITVNLNNDVQALTIKTSRPVYNGSFAIETTKRILKGEYTRAQIKEFTKLEDSSSIKYTKNYNNTFTFTSAYNIALKETESKASLQSEQTALIAGATTQALNLTAVLESSGENQDLYKNPQIKIKLPSQVKNVTYTQIPQLMYANGLELTEGNYKIIEENGQKVLDIKLTGEQTSYLGEAIQGTAISIKTNVIVDQAGSTGNEEIVMTYTNENATKYTDNGTEKINIQISENQTQGGNTGNGEQGTRNQEQTSNEGANSGSGTQNDNNGTGGQQEGQGDNSQNQKQGTIGHLNYSVSARVGGEAIQEGDTVKAGEIIEYTIKLENPTTENIQGVSILATIPEDTTLIEVNSKYPGTDENTGEYTYEEPYWLEKTNKTLTKENIEINSNKTVDFSYMVKVNDDIAVNKEEENICIIRYNNNDKSIKIKHLFVPNTLIANIKPLSIEPFEDMTSNNSYSYTIEIKNNSNTPIENLQIVLNKNDLINIDNVIYSNTETNGELEGNNLTYVINSIPANESTYVKIRTYINKVNEAIPNAEISATIKSNLGDFRTNKLSAYVSNIKMQITSSVQTTNGKEVLSAGDKIKYIFNIKNIGSKDANEIEIKDIFSQYLNIESVSIDGSIYKYIEELGNDNNRLLRITKSIKKEEQIILEITGSVIEEIDLNKQNEIVNQLSIYNFGTVIAESDIIKNYVGYVSNNSNGSTDSNGGNSESMNDKENGIDSNSQNEKNEGNTYINSISGLAWLDENKNGKRETIEVLLENINVSLLNLDTNQTEETYTNDNGEYKFEDIKNGRYIIIFEYDNTIYNLTKYQVRGINATENSDVELVKIKRDGKNITAAATDTLIVKNSKLLNIDIGFIEASIFDLSLTKTVTKITVANSQGTKEYKFKDENLAKIEIKSKYLKGTTVLIEYSIKVTNDGEISGYATSIVDNKPSDLIFNSKLNPDWYQKGNKLYTHSIGNNLIEPGETKEIKLLLTKKMTESNTGLTNNIAEITESFNEFGLNENNSNSSNIKAKENDIGQANVIISVSTGIAYKFLFILLSSIIIIATVSYIICKKVLKTI